MPVRRTMLALRPANPPATRGADPDDGLEELFEVGLLGVLTIPPMMEAAVAAMAAVAAVAVVTDRPLVVVCLLAESPASSSTLIDVMRLEWFSNRLSSDGHFLVMTALSFSYGVWVRKWGEGCEWGVCGVWCSMT